MACSDVNGTNIDSSRSHEDDWLAHRLTNDARSIAAIPRHSRTTLAWTVAGHGRGHGVDSLSRTRADLQPGDLITPGHVSNYGKKKKAAYNGR